jgi:hypothetical protein
MLIILSFSMQLLNGSRENQWMKFWQSRTRKLSIIFSNIFGLLNIIHSINHLRMLILYFVNMNCCLCLHLQQTHTLAAFGFLWNIILFFRNVGSLYLRKPHWWLYFSLWWPFHTPILFFYYITKYLFKHDLVFLNDVTFDFDGFFELQWNDLPSVVRDNHFNFLPCYYWEWWQIIWCVC